MNDKQIMNMSDLITDYNATFSKSTGGGYRKLTVFV